MMFPAVDMCKIEQAEFLQKRLALHEMIIIAMTQSHAGYDIKVD